GLEEPHQIITVIDSNNLEHDGRPKTASHFSASCSGVARPDMMLSAGVAELVDALDLGSSDESCGGSSPSARTKRFQRLPTNLGEPCFLPGIFPAGDLGLPNSLAQAASPAPTNIDKVLAVRPDQSEKKID